MFVRNIPTSWYVLMNRSAASAETCTTLPDAASNLGMSAHVAELTRDIEAVRQLYARDAPWSAESVGCSMQAVLQGAFVFAQAKQSPAVALESLGHPRHPERPYGRRHDQWPKQP
jgi:hypothetical protein